MKRIPKFTLILSVLAVPALVLAQAAHQTHSDADSADEDTDKVLNTTYQHLIDSIRKGGDSNADLDLKDLRESQRAWLKYRDAQVAFVAQHAEVGSASARDAGMASYTDDLNKRRIKDLQDVPNPF